jgi:hypothetical protein
MQEEREEVRGTKEVDNGRIQEEANPVHASAITSE